jgi:WD40 repeat protein
MVGHCGIDDLILWLTRSLSLDRRIFVWDVYSDQDKPIAGFGGPTVITFGFFKPYVLLNAIRLHQGNVFTLDWSTSNKYIYRYSQFEHCSIGISLMSSICA